MKKPVLPSMLQKNQICLHFFCKSLITNGAGEGNRTRVLIHFAQSVYYQRFTKKIKGKA